MSGLSSNAFSCGGEGDRLRGGDEASFLPLDGFLPFSTLKYFRMLSFLGSGSGSGSGAASVSMSEGGGDSDDKDDKSEESSSAILDFFCRGDDQRRCCWEFDGSGCRGKVGGGLGAMVYVQQGSFEEHPPADLTKSRLSCAVFGSSPIGPSHSRSNMPTYNNILSLEPDVKDLASRI